MQNLVKIILIFKYWKIERLKDKKSSNEELSITESVYFENLKVIFTIFNKFKSE